MRHLLLIFYLIKDRDKNIKNEGNLHELSPIIVFTNNLPIKYLVASFKLKINLKTKKAHFTWKIDV